jgi:hypothetical protein
MSTQGAFKEPFLALSFYLIVFYTKRRGYKSTAGGSLSHAQFIYLFIFILSAGLCNIFRFITSARKAGLINHQWSQET